MAENVEVLEIAELSLISKAIMELVTAALKDRKSTVKPKWQYVENTPSIGIYTMQGAVYLEKCIDESFKAQYPFMIRYAVTATANGSRINAQEELDAIGEWLEKATYPELTDNRVIESIERTATSYLYDRQPNNTEIYQCNLNLIYRKRGMFDNE